MIVYSCTDLIFATKIRSTAESLGVSSRPTRDHKALAARLDQVDDGKLNEPVTGLLVDLDLGDRAIELIAQAKSRNPSPKVVVFGSHVATELLENARKHGADFVMARSAFTENLPDILMQLVL